ncbi:IS110 family RNA-guided transposase, partial [Brenneria tiliae]|uniref:IS110 family transposase n=1 Tax=Brenneria tiliae TaxID=2914984 RepID=UPI002014BABA
MNAIGIDISKAKFDLAVERNGKRLNKVFSNTEEGYRQLAVWLDKKGLAKPECRLCMEATSTYYEALALWLHDNGWKVSVVNPLSIKGFAQSQLWRQKTDRADALLIARYCATHQPPEWIPPAPEVRELQRLVARREALIEMRVQETNRQYEAKGESKASIERVLAMLEEEIRQLEEKINRHIDQNPGLKKEKSLLESIPGVGEKLSHYLMAWLRVERLENVRQAVAFVGLSPRMRESGSSVKGRSELSKLGHRRLRKMLYMPALSALKCNEGAKALSGRLKAQGKNGKLIVGAVMRKLVHWAWGVLKSGQAFDVEKTLAK